jgi:hypothetical protein
MNNVVKSNPSHIKVDPLNSKVALFDFLPKGGDDDVAEDILKSRRQL